MPVSAGYLGLRDRAACFDISSRARLSVTGEDRVRLLHALASNEIEGLEPGQATTTFFLNPQGRIQVCCRLYMDVDRVLLETDSDHRQTLIDYLESYIIMDDVALADLTDTTAAIAVEGPQAAAITEGIDVHMVGASPLCASEGVWILTDPDSTAGLADQLALPEASEDDCLRARVENHRPVHGVDYSDRNIPHETDLLEFVSFNKGCYVGQEIVERVHSRGQVNRVLRAIELDTQSLPEDLTIRSGDKELGTLTSPVLAGDGKRVLGLSLLPREVRTGDLEVNGAKASWREL